jgi:uncharacterized membrane protein
MSAPEPYPPRPAPPRKLRRVLMWVFIAVQVIFLVWIIVGVVTATGNPECGDLNADDCGSETGAGSVGMIVVLWTAVDLVLGIAYIIVRAISGTRGDADPS